jgi:Secretion system C-terminal sorting domain
MKNSIVIILCMLFIGNTYSQRGTYSFDYYQSNFQIVDTSNAIKLSPDSVWLYWWKPISIGFDFDLFGKKYDSVNIVSEGLFHFFQQCHNSSFPIGPAFLSFFVGLEDRGAYSGNGDTSESDVLYIVEGVVGSRILKVEWKNVTFEGGGGWYDYFNYQVWLFENKGTIEIHFGPYNIDDIDEMDWASGVGPLTTFNYDGTCNDPRDSTQNIVVFGNPSTPQDTVVGDIDFTDLPIYWIDGMPPNGIVYRFRYVPVGIKNIKNIEYSISPNPANDQIQIRTGLEGESEIVFYDLQGRAVLQQKFYGNAIISMAHLPQGLYPYRLTDNKARTVRGKVVVLR